MLRSTIPIALLALAAAAPARAHQAPEVDANNRYIKVVLLPDRVRLVETLLYGERPGAAERRRMDTSGDGLLDEQERATFAARVAAELAPEVSLGGAPAPGWRVTDVGVGDPPRVAGGTFAIDLSLDLPYPDPRADEQSLRIDDRAAVPAAGEAELRIDESPGVRLRECHLASERAGIEQRYAWRGNARAAGERAVVVRFSVDEELRPRRRPPWALIAGGAAAGLALAAALLVWRQRKVKG